MNWGSLDDWDLSVPPKCGLDGPHTERFDDAAAVNAQLREFASQPGVSGWVSCPGSVRAVNGPEGVPDGPLLDAELSAGCTSLSLRHLGETWIVTTVTRTEGDSHWVLAEELVAVPLEGAAAGGRVQYELFWAVDAADVEAPDGWCRPVGSVASRFVGFVGGAS